MEEKPELPPQIPVVPMNAPTLRANIVLVQYHPGNGGITLNLVDQRDAPVMQVGDVPKTANFEVGRFELTPRALRILADTIHTALKAYREDTGSDLPTLDQFNARLQMPNLQNLLQPPKPPDGTS